MLRILLSPDSSHSGADRHSSSVLSLREHESKTDTHHVGVVFLHPLPLADPDVVADDNHKRAEDGEDDGEDTGRGGDGERRVSDGHSGSTPCGNGGDGESTRLGVDVDDAGVCGCEELEHCWREEDSYDCADTLGEPLLDGRSAEQESSTEIARQIGRLIGTVLKSIKELDAEKRREN
jgi:hypothetical protein